MSEIKLVSPMLDDFAIGDPISEHSGVRCCPAMHKESENKYIVKIITIPPTEAQIDALVLSGAYPDKASALKYFKALADDIIGEVKILNSLATAEGFLPIDATQVVESEDESGYDVYLRSAYAVTLQRQMRNGSLTHLSALNLGLDLCAALAAARHNGYLYIDLKPANIYIGNANEYRIGDIGFIRLDSLRYASLPERYRSEYTAPEITDAYASLNTTLDIYALGQVLYQVFNDGNLPVADESGVIPAPAYADYEIAEIILKACALNPEDRWQDPTELGQALITYMQKNGAHDTPITPVAPSAEPAEVVLTTDEADGAYVKTDEEDSEVAPEEATEEAESEAVEEVDDAVTAEEITEEDIYTEDEDGNLTLIEEETDETETETATEDIDYTEVSDEVSGILQQADDLIEHEVPDPVVQPEPIDVPMPEPIVLEEQVETVEESDEAREVAENTEEESATEEDTETADEETAEEDSAPVEDAEKVPASGEEESEELPDEEIEDEEPAPKKSNTGKWVAGILITLLVAALLVAGFFFVKEYYLQSIDAITLTAGNAGELYVGITTEADEAELVVVCTNTYGNKQTATLKDGKAFFKDLMPNSAYTISIETTGFHYLIGDTSASYVTPNTTEIIQFTAVTGPEDGSVILSFTVSGPDSDSWIITYNKDDGAKESVVFSGHFVTISGLTPEKNYTFTLTPEKQLDMIGTTTIEHTAKEIVKAESMVATGCNGTALTVAWNVQEDVQVESWTVRCYNDNYDTTIVVTEPQAAFEITDDTASYTVEVTASGMSVSERVVIPANSTTVTDFAVAQEGNELVVSWTPTKEMPVDGWILSYITDGAPAKELICDDNTARVSPIIPDATYLFTLQTADGEIVLGGVQAYQSAESATFEGYAVAADDMEFKMCLTPSNSNWDRYDLSKSDYTTEFDVGEKASFLVRLKKAYNTSKDSIETLFVIRDADGNIVSATTSTRTWSNMWYRNYCELDIPAMPQVGGEYTISVYFNQNLAYSGTFTITN